MCTSSCGWRREDIDQNWGSHEEVIKGVLQQVDPGGGVQVCISNQLAGKQCLRVSAAQEAAHLTVGNVHSVGQNLQNNTRLSCRHDPSVSSFPLTTRKLSCMQTMIHLSEFICFNAKDKWQVDWFWCWKHAQTGAKSPFPQGESTILVRSVSLFQTG